MIIGVVGPIKEDNDAVVAVLAEQHPDYPVVDGLSLVRSLPDTLSRENLLYSDDRKLQFINTNVGSNCILTGNVLLTASVAESLLQSGNVALYVVQKPSLEDYPQMVRNRYQQYWGNENVTLFELQTRYNDFYQSLYKKYQQEIHLVTDPDQVKEHHMSGIEDAIKAALAELESPSEAPVEDTVEEVHVEVVEVEDPEPIHRTPIIAPEEQDEGLDGYVFMKVSDGKMAILFPESLELKSEELAGQRFRKITVETVNLADRKLQQLAILDSDSPSEKPTQKTHLNQPSESDVPAITGDEHFEDLKSQKAQLDEQIKLARKLGDTERVNELRKQRRAVRYRINSIIKHTKTE